MITLRLLIAAFVRPYREPIGPAVRRAVFVRDGGRCRARRWFGLRRCPGYGPLEVDHVWPVRWGGSARLSNLQLLCDRCNARKHDRVPRWVTARVVGELVAVAVLIGTLTACRAYGADAVAAAVARAWTGIGGR